MTVAPICRIGTTPAIPIVPGQWRRSSNTPWPFQNSFRMLNASAKWAKSHAMSIRRDGVVEFDLVVLANL